MTDRTSLYIGEALRRLLEGRPDGKGLWSKSGLINTVASRYQEVVRRHMPSLTLQEWCAVMDSLNGIWLQSTDRDAAFLTSVWAEVYDADRLDGVGSKWGCDARALAERIREYDYATVVALVDAVERWWALDNDGMPFEETIPAVVGENCVRSAE